MDVTTTTENPVTEKGNWSFRLSDPAMKELLVPMENPRSRVNDAKIRRLFLQASAQQWYGPERVDFEQSIEVDEESRRVWIRLNQIFYTLEKMGLRVIQNMTYKAVRKMRSDDMAYYLAVQAADEARHVFLLENYLKKLGQAPKYNWALHVLEPAASAGFYRVENWLFSTLFSENFAHAFLKAARKANIDPIGATICKNLQLDESRHLHFLHIVLPDIYERMSLFGKAYLKASQFFIMKFSELISRTLTDDVAVVGIDRRDFLEEVFTHVERSYKGFGINTNFVPFPKIRNNKISPLAQSI